jgi:hypothetical protein
VKSITHHPPLVKSRNDFLRLMHHIHLLLQQQMLPNARIDRVHGKLSLPVILIGLVLIPLVIAVGYALLEFLMATAGGWAGTPFMWGLLVFVPFGVMLLLSPTTSP